MAEAVYNWAKMSDKPGSISDNKNMKEEDVVRLKNLYKTMWKSLLTPLVPVKDKNGKTLDAGYIEKSFNDFFNESLKGKIGKLSVPQTDKKGRPIFGEDGLQVVEVQENVKVDGNTFLFKLREEFRKLTALNGKEQDLNKTAFKEAMKSAKPTMSVEGKDVPDVELYEALQMVATQYGRTNCMNSDTHMAAGFLTGLGYHMQQGCGQGKSSAVATATYMKRGKNANTQMFVTSSTKELATQSFSDIMGYFDDLGIGQGGSPEKVFLMTENGPEVAVRTADGSVLTNNLKNGTQNDGFDDTQCCETEAVKFVVKDGKVSIAQRSDKNPKLDKEGKVIPNRLGWEEPSFTYAELASQPNGKQLQNQALQAIYGNKENIIIADNATIVQDNMKGAIPSKDKNGNAIQRHVMMDEGDYVKNDQFHFLQQVGELYKDQGKRTADRRQARAIIEALDIKNNQALVEKDKETQFVQFTDFGINAVKSYCSKNKIPLTNEMMNFIEEALVVETVFVQNVDYVVEGGKVISQAKASGSEMNLPEGIAQALAVKHGLEPAPEHKVYNIQTIMGAYRKLFGEKGQTRLSGTHEADTLKGNDGRVAVVANRELPGVPQTEAVQTAKKAGNYQEAVSTYFQNTRTRSLLENQDQIDAAIMVETDIVLKSGRPVLIGCVASQDVEAMKKKLRTQYGGSEPQTKDAGIVEQWGAGEDAKTVITYTAETSKRYEADLKQMSEADFRAKYHIPPEEKMSDFDKFDKFVKQMGGRKNTIVLGTSIVGRGANIKVKSTNALGGLHVITRGLHPSSVRQMIQFINRSKRGADNGSSHEYFSFQEVEKRIPEIEAAINQNKEEIKLLQGKTDPESVARLSELQAELDEFEAVHKMIVSKKAKVGTFSSKDGAKGIMDMLDDKEVTVLVDNDGNPTEKEGKKENNIGERIYRGFYGVADRRNRMLAEKASAIEEVVTLNLENLKTFIMGQECGIEMKAKLAQEIIPEYMGRALQVQYKANGHTRQKITEQCRGEIALIGTICLKKAEAIINGKEFDEAKTVKDLVKQGYVNRNVAKRVFVLSETEVENMQEENREKGDDVLDQVITATVEHLSPEQLKAAYDAMNKEGASLGGEGRVVNANDIIEAIKTGKVTYDKVVAAIAKVQAAAKGKEGPEVENIKQ